jgi:hypothetical protein
LLVLARLLEWAGLDSSVICVGICLEFDCDILFCGVRYDDMVLEAVLGLNEPDGSSSAAIANYIEVLCSAVLMHMFMFKSLRAV